MKSTYRFISPGAAVCLMLSGCSTPIPFTGTLEQSEPRDLSATLKLPDAASPVFVIAGLQQGAVPQGMVCLPNSTSVLTSHYFDNGTPSCIVSTDTKTAGALATFQLLEPDGRPHKGHVGGLAADGSSLWIASDKHLYRSDPAPVLHPSASGTLQTLEQIRTEATEEVAFCSVFDGLVWAGEFALGSTYPTHASHHLIARDGEARKGWLCGYEASNGFKCPVKVLSIPDRTQGAVATDTHIFLSRSYGRRNRSSIDIYTNPLREDPHRSVKTSAGHEVPLWFLDGRNLVHSIDLPPMSENICIHEGDLYILFESGARKFRLFGKQPLDYVIRLKLEKFNP